MADIDALTLDTEDMLYGLPQIERPPEDTLITAVSDAPDTSWRWATEAMHKRGDLWEYVTSDGSIGEVVIEAEDHPPDGDITVRRAQQRTTAASSYSAGDVFRKNPPFTRVKIQRFLNEIIDGLWPDVWIRTQRSLDLNPGRLYYPLTAVDYEVEDVHQADISSVSLGAATFDVTGGGVEDEWTLASHGLAVGDPVRFTAVGTGAEPYAVNTVYWVATVPDANTFTLSATESTTILEGTGTNSAGTWTLEKVLFAFEPLPRDAWEVVTSVDSRTSNTNRILRLKTVYSTDASLYYSAKTKPSSSAVADIPEVMADFIPYGAMWLLLGGTRVVPTRIDPARALPPQFSPSQAMADSRFFRDEFDRRKGEYRRQLLADKKPRNYLRRNAVVRR